MAAIRLDVFVVALFLVLQVGFALVAFFFMLAGRFGPRLRYPVYLALAVQWLVLFGFAFLMLNWAMGLISLLLSPVYAVVARPLAARYAERLRRE